MSMRRIGPLVALCFIWSARVQATPRAEIVECSASMTRFFSDVDRVKRENSDVQGSGTQHWRQSIAEATGLAVEISYENFAKRTLQAQYNGVRLPLVETTLGKDMIRVDGSTVLTFYGGYQLKVATSFFPDAFEGKPNRLDTASARLNVFATLLHQPKVGRARILGSAAGQSQSRRNQESQLSAGFGLDNIDFLNGILNARADGVDLSQDLATVNDRYHRVVRGNYVPDGSPLSVSLYCDLILPSAPTLPPER